MARKCPNGCGRDGVELLTSVTTCNACYTEQLARERRTEAGKAHHDYDPARGDKLYASHITGWYWMTRDDGHQRPLPPGAGYYGSWSSAHNRDLSMAAHNPSADPGYEPGSWFAWDGTGRTSNWRLIGIKGVPPGPLEEPP